LRILINLISSSLSIAEEKGAKSLGDIVNIEQKRRKAIECNYWSRATFTNDGWFCIRNIGYLNDYSSNNADIEYYNPLPPLLAAKKR